MKNYLLFACTVAALFSACKKGDNGLDGSNGPQGLTGPAGPKLKGSITGYVSHYDIYGDKMLTSLKGDTIKIDELNLMTTVDSTGKWRFDSIQTGIYNFTLMRNAFGLTKIQSLQFTGGSTLNIKDVRISQTPTYSVTSITPKDSTFQTVTGLYINGTIPAATTIYKKRTILVYVGLSNSVSPSNYLFVQQVNENQLNSKNGPSNLNTFTAFFSYADLHNLGLNATSNVYFAAYVATANYNNSSNYEDVPSGRIIYTALSSSAATANAVVK